MRRTFSRAAEATALSAVVLAPLLRGLVHLPTWGVVAGLGGAAAVLLSFSEERPRLSLRALVGFALLSLLLLQLVPLPPGLVQLLAPENAELLDATLGSLGAWPAWRPLSLDPPATAQRVLEAVGLLLIFLVLQSRAQRSSRARVRALSALVIGGALVAAISLGHALIEQPALFGVLAPERPSPLVSTFGNANQHAAYLAAVLPAALVLAIIGTGLVRGGWIAAVLLLVAACAGAGSRSGWGALAIGLVAGGLLAFVAGRGARDHEERVVGRRVAGLAGATLALGLVSVLAAAALHVDVQKDLVSLLHPDAWLAGPRLEALRLGWRVFASSPLLGVGRGAFGTVHPHLAEQASGFTFTHVENEPLQLLAELGAPGGIVAIGLVLAAVLALVLRARRHPLEGAALAGALALLAASFVDYALSGAAGLALVVLLAAREKERSRLVALERLVPVGIAGLIGLGVVSGSFAAPGLRAETDALVEAVATLPLPEADARCRAALVRRPADWLPSEACAVRHLTLGDPRGALTWLNRALAANPVAGSAHLRVAEALLKLGRRSQALLELRIASRNGADGASAVLAWFGPNEAAVLAAAPVEAEPASLFAAELYRRQHFTLALAVAEQALVVGETPGLRNTARSAAERAQDWPKVLEHARALQALEPEEPGAWLAEVHALANAGRPSEARKRAEEAAARFPEHGDVQVALAVAALGAGQPAEALLALDRALAAGDVPRLGCEELRSRALLTLGRDEEARDALRFVLRGNPERFDLRVQLAELYLRLRDPILAQAELVGVPLDAPGAAALRAKLR